METCLVFFRSGTCDLTAAEAALARCGLTVVSRGDRLVASRPGSPEFTIRVDAGEWVRPEAAEIAAGTPQPAELSACDARFEVNFDSLDDALSEINTLMEVQVTLQEASGGFLFLPWNGNVLEPQTPPVP